MIVDKEEISKQIATEYNRRINGVPFKPDSDFIISKVEVKKTNDGKFKVVLQATNGPSWIPDILLSTFIEFYQHPFDYDKFGLNDPNK